MSKEQAKEFFEAISRDKQLAEEVKQVVGGRTSNEVKAKALFDLARGHGFNFSKNEAISLTRDELKTSLQIESLSDVSGGAKGSIKPAVMAAFLLAGMGVSGAAMSNMEASAAPPKVQAEQRVNSYDVYTAEDFVSFFTRKDYQGQATRGVTITLHSDISLTAEQAGMVSRATNLYNPEPGNPHDMSFHGTLDGGGHSITLNFTEIAGGWFGGLFTFTHGATFRNLHVQFDRLTRVSGVLVDTATDSTFDSVVVTGRSLEDVLKGKHNGWPLAIGSIGSKCFGTCKLTNCIARIESINIRSEQKFCPLHIGGLVGHCHTTVASGCSFSGNIAVSSTTSDVHAGGIVGCADPSHCDGSSVIDNCVVSNSQINANTNTNDECTAGAIAGRCVSDSVVRHSAALNCSVNAGNGYAGQIVGCSVPRLGYSPFRISEAFDEAESDAPEPQIYGCFYTNGGPAVGRERTQNHTSAIQAAQGDIIDVLPDLVPVIERLQNQQEQQTGLFSGTLKWLGSLLGFGGEA